MTVLCACVRNSQKPRCGFTEIHDLSNNLQQFVHVTVYHADADGFIFCELWLVSLQRNAFVSEPAILVKRKGEANQVWSMEKLDLKLIDMREVYNELKSAFYANGSADASFAEECESQIGTNYPDPFYHNSTENHNLVGVANIFLSALFHDVVLDYHTPIISPQGEVSGRLQVEIQKLQGQFPPFQPNSNVNDQDQSSNMTIKVTKHIPTTTWQIIVNYLYYS